MPAVSTLKGVGPQLSNRLEKLQIREVADLLFHLPLRYQDKTEITPISSLQPGDEKLVEGVIQGCAIRFGRRRSLLCTIANQNSTLTIRLFHFNKQQQSSLKSGGSVRCFGEIRRGPSGLEMVHPEYKILQPDKPSPELEKNLTPIYPATDGVRQRTLLSITTQALIRALPLVVELLPDIPLLKQMPSLQEALQTLHRPTAETIASLPLCRERIAFEELLAHHLSLQQLRNSYRKDHAISLPYERGAVDSFIEQLPFTLTAAQQRAIDEIFLDMHQDHPMQRLLQGDVGSGKTIVAICAVLHASSSGLQAALMAPTELLARQHYKNISNLLETLEISTGFLSGSMNTKERAEVTDKIGSGEISIVVGTHALFQKNIQFKNLALIIIDEQHRFGVGQRQALQQKGSDDTTKPHQLIMTATPIPRTLAMTFYADLDSTIIDELPPGRTPITTVTIPESRRDEVLERVHVNCKQGRQAYWVCPLIEESETLQCQAASESAKEIQQQFPDLSVGLVHGRMPANEKDEVMDKFHRGEIHILVATTVIEVGVDVPNASLMIIENAERLGLSQLHQLRGRVGRGTLASSCLLMYRTPLSKIATERLTTIRESNDGFEIARKDLEMRGPGELLGRRQTGIPQLRIADLARDQLLIPTVEDVARQMLQNSPQDKITKLIQRWMPDAERYRSTG